MDRILATAEVIATVRLNRTLLHSFAPDAPHDEAESYRMQDAVPAPLSADLGASVGERGSDFS